MVVSEVMEAFMKLFVIELENKRYNASFIEAMAWCFIPDSNLHSHQCFQISEQELRKLRIQHQKWREDIVAGDRIDVCIQADDKGKITGWAQATVLTVKKEEAEFELAFDELPPTYDGTLDIWSNYIAKYESRTKDNYAWRNEKIVNCATDGSNALELDGHDNTSWCKSTVLAREKQFLDSREVEMIYVGFRVYRETDNQYRKDNRGTFEGWSDRFDEWVPAFSPRIQPFESKSGKKSTIQEADLEEDGDEMIEPEEGHTRVYTVPRNFKCTSQKFIHFMNQFGNQGGFNMIIDLLEDAEASEVLHMQTLMNFSILMSLPAVTYHKVFMSEFGTRITQAIKARLMGASDKNVRDIKKDKVEILYKVIGTMQLRTMERNESSKNLEIFKLDMCKKYLASENLEPRIQGMRELKDVIDNNKSWSMNKQLTIPFLVEWMVTNKVFEIFWGKRTHQQLVERSSTIYKLLLDEDFMTNDLLQMIWDLSGTFKAEVYKIITDNSYALKQKQKEFISAQITEKPAQNLDMQDFDLLSEIGRFCHDTDFKVKLSEFFWKIVTDSEQCDEELLENCINKFAEMIKQWELEQKKPFFDRLTEQMQKTENSALPVLKLFRKLINDEKNKVATSSYGKSKKNKAAKKTLPNSWILIGTMTWGKLLPKLKKADFDFKTFYNKLTAKQKTDLIICMKNAVNSTSVPVIEQVPTYQPGSAARPASPKNQKGGPHDFDMPPILDDETKVRISKWKHMKGYAMKENIEAQHWYIAFNDKEQLLIQQLVLAQNATGEKKGALDPVPNPLYGKDDEEIAAEEPVNEPEETKENAVCSKGDLVCPKIISDETIVSQIAWKTLKNIMMDRDISIIWSLNGFDDDDKKLLEELFKAQKETGDDAAELKPMPNPNCAANGPRDAEFDPFEGIEDNGPALDEAQIWHNLLGDHEYAEDSEEEEPEQPAEKPVVLTFDSLLTNLHTKQQLVVHLLNNLEVYCKATKSKIEQEPELLKLDRQKMFPVSKKHSHSDEIQGRLLFLEYYATESSFMIKKDELRAIFDLLTKTGVKSDMTTYFNWCKEAYEDQKSYKPVLDLTDVEAFFIELMDSKILDLKTLPLVGFEFLAQYWIAVNEKANNILQKIKHMSKEKEVIYSWQKDREYDKVDQDHSDDPPFTVFCEPKHLLKIDMIWQVVLESEQPDVYTRAIRFLTFMYMALEQNFSIVEKSNMITQQLIQKCFELIEGDNPSPFLVKRVMLVLTNILQMSEKQGTGDVQPHNAVLKGEMLDRIIINNLTSPKAENIVVRVFTSATVWEFRKEVSRLIELSPKYVEFELSDKSKITDSMNGMVLEQIGLKNQDIITVRMIDVKEEVAVEPICDLEKSRLTPKAYKIFNEWYDLYKDPEKEKMTKTSACRFILGVTNEFCKEDDKRITSIFSNYAKNDTTGESLDREEFLKFYYMAAKDKIKSVHENLEHSFIRTDLKKYSEIVEETAYSKTEMPRYMISGEQKQFDKLMNLLNRNDEASPHVWNLIRSLATNQQLYKQVLSFSEAREIEDGPISWEKFFSGSSMFKQIYILEIIEELMEAGNTQSDTRRVAFVENQVKVRDQVGKQAKQWTGVNIVDHKISEGFQAKLSEKLAGASQKSNQAMDEASQPADADNHDMKSNEDHDDLAQARQEWTSTFLENGGFKYILTQFQTKKITSASADSLADQFELKQISFMLVLLRIISTAAFATDSSKNIGEAVALVRKSSSCPDEEMIDEVTLKRKFSAVSASDSALNKLMSDGFASDILIDTEFSDVCRQIMDLVSQITQKSQFTLEDKIIVENAMALWTGCILNKPELFNEFVDWKNSDQTSAVKDVGDFILGGLLRCPEEKIRLDFKNTFSSLSIHFSTGSNSALVFLLGFLANNFKEISNNPARQFFELFNELIALNAEINEFEDQSTIYDPMQLLTQIIEKIKEIQEEGRTKKIKPVDEENLEEVDELKVIEKAADQERLLVGLINLTEKILRNVDEETSEKIIEQQDLIKQIFQEFLFASYYQNQDEKGESQIKLVLRKGSNKNRKKQQSTNSGSKEAAYKLLIQLIKKSKDVMHNFLGQQLQPLITNIKQPDRWNYKPPGQGDRGQAYVGIKNLGCICYMISMLQQFFMVPCFRYNLFCVDDGLPMKLVDFKGRKYDDNMLHQLQKLMANLELSERPAYDPSSWCFAFKDFDGEPTPIMEQKDSQEFLNMLFDRVETALMKTPRKYLTQCIFGGKNVSQMVCMECGKIKNRHEDFYNISLQVRDRKSVYESLQDQIKGEIISDFKCDGCNKTVDLSKRTLIAEAPNVLVVHLQRIEYNFESDKLDKINSHFKFPHILDLTPYTYYDVMEKEGRLPKKKGEEDEEGEVKDEDLTQEELKKKKEAEEDFKQPEHDDCFEYKLVGVNVHSGTADAGHYWSYINTNRGTDEKAGGDPTWMQTENDPWMEFNDSMVSDYKFENLDEDVSGEEQTQQVSSYGMYGGGFSWGGKYGKSAYMLFYERRRKKDIKLVVPEDKVEEEKKKNVKITYNEEKKEYTKMVNYRESADGEEPTKNYKKVFEDNKAFTFESDIYSNEFFNFLLQILSSVAELGENADDVKLSGLQIGVKAGFEILARCEQNQGIADVAQVMIDILKTSDELCRTFMEALLDENDAEVIMQILIEGKDTLAQKHVARVMKYLLCKMKMLEKEDIEQETKEEYEATFTDSEGKKHTLKKQRFKALSLQFLEVMLAYLPQRAAKAWKTFEQFNELFFAFGVFDPSEIQEKWTGETTTNCIPFDKNGEAYQIGIGLYFRRNMLEIIGNFVLGSNSPMHVAGEPRIQMGTNWTKPNFSALMGVITTMMTDEAMIAKYPFSENSQKIIGCKEILSMLMNPENDFTGMLSMMCKDNFKLSKKMAKVHVKNFNKQNQETLDSALKSLRSYILIDDDLKKTRFDWVFGVPQIVTAKFNQSKTVQYGIQNIDKIGDSSYDYKTQLFGEEISDYPFFKQILYCKDKMDTLASRMVLEIIYLCVQDDDICRYVFETTPPTYQYARYSDWFYQYTTEQKAHVEKMSKSNPNVSSFYEKRLECLGQIINIYGEFEEKCNKLDLKEQALKEANKDGFKGAEDVFMGYESTEVLRHWPPRIIVGKQRTEGEEIQVQAHELVNVRLIEVENDWMYSNPTGMFNLSLPEKAMKTSQYGYQTTTFAKFMNDKLGGNLGDQIPVKHWTQDKSQSKVLLKIIFDDEALTVKSKINVKLSVADNEKKNVIFPDCPLSYYLSPNFLRTAFTFTKIDPSKEGWGDITIDIDVKGQQTRQIPSVQTNTNAVTNITVQRANSNDSETGGSGYECNNVEGSYDPLDPSWNNEANDQGDQMFLAQQIAAAAGPDAEITCLCQNSDCEEEISATASICPKCNVGQHRSS